MPAAAIESLDHEAKGLGSQKEEGGGGAKIYCSFLVVGFFLLPPPSVEGQGSRAQPFEPGARHVDKACRSHKLSKYEFKI